MVSGPKKSRVRLIMDLDADAAGGLVALAGGEVAAPDGTHSGQTAGDDLAATVGALGGQAAGGEVAALAGARIGQKLYMPSALLANQLPAGLGSMTRVPRLMDLAAEDDAARLELYINTIRRTARVFEVGNCKTETAVEYDCYMGWINTWLCLSGFGSFVTVAW